MFEEVNRRDWLRFTLVFAVIGLPVAYLNRTHVIERTILRLHHIPLSEYLRGEGERVVTTYPLWGYALLISVVGSDWGLLILQIVFSSATLALFLLVLRAALPEHRQLQAGILIAALPWYFLHSVYWPDSPAITLVLCAALALLYGYETKRLSWAAVAGVLLGLSLNFRPERLLLPVAIFAIWLLSRGMGERRPGAAPGLRLAALLSFACVSWALLIPWAIHYHAETGRYSVTSSNGGMVAYISLGQLPGNPWGVMSDDRYAGEVLRAAGVQEPAWSDTGGEVLMQRFRQGVRSHPGAYAQKILWNLRSMLMAGFYVGDPRLPDEEWEQLDVLRERIKLALGVNPNLREIEEYRQKGVWEHPKPAPRAVALLVWQLVGTALGALFLLIALAGMISVPRRILAEPLLLICAAIVLYQIALVGALLYHPRHMNGIFVFLVPFFVIGVDRGVALVGQARSFATSK